MVVVVVGGGGFRAVQVTLRKEKIADSIEKCGKK